MPTRSGMTHQRSDAYYRQSNSNIGLTAEGTQKVLDLFEKVAKGRGKSLHTAWSEARVCAETVTRMRGKEMRPETYRRIKLWIINNTKPRAAT